MDYADLDSLLDKDVRGTDGGGAEQEGRGEVEKNLLPSKPSPFSFSLLSSNDCPQQKKSTHTPGSQKCNGNGTDLFWRIDVVNGSTGKKEGKTRLMNVIMQVWF